jgi:hypothetical protein
MSNPSNRFGPHSPLPPDSIEDTFVHVTSKQINYIEILRGDLGFTLEQRNAHITSIVGKR